MSFNFNFNQNSNQNTTPFGSNANQGTGFGNNNTSSSFGTTGGFGFGSNQNNTSGFGQTNNTGFGQSGNSSGFGQTANNTGFGQTSTGFGQTTNNTGFGQTTNNTGFGQTANNTGFGQTANNTGFGLGQTGNNTGFGQTNTTSGFGQNNANSGFGQTNTAQNVTLTQDYQKDIKLDSSITLPDSISCLKWINPVNGASPPIFAATCWDKSVRLFQFQEGQMNASITQSSIANLPQPATCLTWNPDNTTIYAGCIDGVIRAIDTNTMSFTQVGKHNAGISSVHFSPQQNVLISTAYQDKIHFWQGNPNPVTSISVENKVYVSDYSNNLLAGATANERIFFIDTSALNVGSKTLIDSADLGKYSQIQSLCLDQKAQNIGLTTVDGRSNISSISRVPNSHGFKTHALITFKSNKVEEGGNVVLYPTNTSCFNPFLECWFLTGGSDGTLSYWDYKARNKIKTFSFNIPVCHAQVSPNGKMVAYSLGNDWHIGQQGIGKWPNLLGVHYINDNQHKFNGVGNKR